MLLKNTGACRKILVATKTVKKLTPFGKYLKKHHIGPGEAAKELDVSRSYINALASGAQSPGLKLAIFIFDWSKGVVTVQSWVK